MYPNEELKKKIEEIKKNGLVDNKKLNEDLIKQGYKTEEIQYIFDNLEYKTEEIGKNKETSNYNKPIFGGLAGLLIGALTPISTFIFPDGFAGPLDFIFHYLNTSFFTSSHSDFIIVLWIIEYTFLGILLGLLLDERYIYKKKIIITTSFLIIFVVFPYFVYQYYNSVIDNINKYSTIETCNSFFPSDQKNECLFNLADNTNNSDVCKKIIEESSYHYQQNNCFLRVAVNKMDSSLCPESDSVDHYCLAEIVAISNNDADSCLKRLAAPNNVAHCIYSIAVNTKNKELCKKIEIYNYDRQTTLFYNKCLVDVK